MGAFVVAAWLLPLFVILLGLMLVWAVANEHGVFWAIVGLPVGCILLVAAIAAAKQTWLSWLAYVHG
jgi:hypothetical protein